MRNYALTVPHTGAQEQFRKSAWIQEFIDKEPDPKGKECKLRLAID